jgi:hypothetical protein
VLTAGTLYHLHWHNNHANPAKNFVSVDNIFVWHPTTPRQPTIPDTDLAVLVGNKSSDPEKHVPIRVIATDSPIFQLHFANGAVQGQGYMEPWVEAPVDISGAAKLGEQFTVSGSDRVVTSVSVRVNRASGSSPLIVTLATDSGSVIEQGRISATTFPQGALVGASDSAKAVWGAYAFALPRTLKLGQSYRLILSAAGDTRYQTYGIRKGSLYSYKAPTFFGDGYGQVSTNDGATWTGFTQAGGTSNRTDADIQFYFVTR